MKVNKEQKQAISKQYCFLSKVEHADFIEFEKKLYMAKQDLEAPIFYWVALGCDAVREHFKNYREYAIVEHSEFKIGEV